MLEQQQRAGLMQFHTLADRTDWEVCAAHILGDFCELRIVLCSVIDRDAIGGEGNLSGEECAVVIDVQPAFGAGMKVA